MAIRKKLMDKGFTLIELMIVVAIVGVLAVLAVYGVRKYIANAKTAEAKNSIGQMSKDALTKYEGESMQATVMAPAGQTALLRDVCASSTVVVPSAVPSAAKYQSQSSDWNADGSATPAKGFSCLHFEMAQPQYYQYNYLGTTGATANFTAEARGDLNGDGITSTFRQVGSVIGGRLNVAPSIEEIGAEE